MPRLLATLALLALTPCALGEEPPRPLEVDWVLDGVVTGATLTAWGVSGLLDNTLAPRTCRWCGTLGVDAHRGVVDERGESFAYPGLHVLDGAVVPGALAVNPSLTIAAVAERACQLMLHDVDLAAGESGPG